MRAACLAAAFAAVAATSGAVVVAGGGNATTAAAKAVARCAPLALTAEGAAMAAAGRPIVIHVQTLTASKSNLCEGSRADWREGMAQCLRQLTGLRVVAKNFDGTCADCGALARGPCGELLPEGGPPAALVLLLGGGWDANLRFACANHYCGTAGAPFAVDAGRHPPFDFLGACDAFVSDRRGAPLLGPREVARLGPGPKTRIGWFPILSPHSELRALYERSLVFAPDPTAASAPPDVSPPPGATRVGDYEYLKTVVAPRFLGDGARAARRPRARESSPLFAPSAATTRARARAAAGRRRRPRRRAAQAGPPAPGGTGPLRGRRPRRGREAREAPPLRRLLPTDERRPRPARGKGPAPALHRLPRAQASSPSSARSTRRRSAATASNSSASARVGLDAPRGARARPTSKPPMRGRVGVSRRDASRRGREASSSDPFEARLEQVPSPAQASASPRTATTPRRSSDSSRATRASGTASRSTATASPTRR